MNRKNLYIVTAMAGFIFAACNNNPKLGQDNSPVAYHAPDTVHATDTVTVAQGLNSKGIGRFKNVALTHPLDAAMAEKGKSIYEAKCGACHKLTDEKLVGPGWKGVSDRRTPEWVMNFITNTAVMLDKDLAAQAEVVTCIVRMPNQDLTDEQARQILEFMRKNDNKN